MDSALLLQGYYLLKPLINERILYLQIRGTWKEREMYKFANYIEDVEEMGKKFKDSFIALADLRYMEPVSYKVAEIHTEAQKRLMESGLVMAIEVLSLNRLSWFSAERFSFSSGMKKKSFISMEHALAWISEMKCRILK